MSTNTLITRTNGRSLEPHQVRLLDRYGQIAGTLGQTLGPAHAALFAEPVRMGAGSGSDIAWYAEGDVEPIPLASLPPDAAARAQQRLERLLAEIVALADRLARQGEASLDLANSLRLAVRVPSRDAIWIAGEQPILVDWGRQTGHADAISTPATAAPIIAAREEPEAAPGPGRPVAPPPPPALSPPPPRRGLPGLPGAVPALWIVFALLVGVLAARLLHACGIGDETWPRALRDLFPQYCTTTAGMTDPAYADIVANLESRIRAAELAIVRKVAACEVTCAPPPSRRAEAPASPATVPLQPIQDDLARRIPTDVQRGQFLEVTLAWDGPADLDIFVRCPSGQVIDFNSKQACGGKLVEDENSGGGRSDSRPVEHVIWADAAPPPGVYTVGINLYSRHADVRTSIPFEIAIWKNGRVVRAQRGETSATSVLQTVLSLTSPLE